MGDNNFVDGIKPDSFDRFTHRWITPATLVIVIGFIVWGVQLNIITLQSVERIAELNKEGLRMSSEIAGLSGQRLEALAITAATVKALDVLERRITRNETWIIENRDNQKP